MKMMRKWKMRRRMMMKRRKRTMTTKLTVSMSPLEKLIVGFDAIGSLQL
jgi:hypothetical protein